MCSRVKSKFDDCGYCEHFVVFKRSGYVWATSHPASVVRQNHPHTSNRYQPSVGTAPYLLGDVKREELLRTGSMILHEHYFGNLGGDGKIAGDIVPLLVDWFSSAETWEAEFRKVAIGLGGGSGWAILSFNVYTGELHNQWAGDRSRGLAWEAPLLVCDMYEHAYSMDFGAAAPKYVDAFMRNVNWREVNRRMVVAQTLNKSLGA